MELPGGPDEAGLLAAARDGDSAAFDQLVAPYRRELTAHCYRLLGSVQDAEDAVQESLLSAWRGLGGFAGRSSLRTWLYRIATHASLRLSSKRPRRLLSPDHGPARTSVVDLGEPVPGPVWLEPLPTEGDVVDRGTDPAEAYVEREGVELAFVAALQHLPATQRAVLILREVLQYSAAEAADLLDTTPAPVNSAPAPPSATACPPSASATSCPPSARRGGASSSTRSSPPGSGPTCRRCCRCWPRTPASRCRRSPPGSTAAPTS
ncbi:RNA polymerase subunit sigma-70 [Jiangella rhizosphaerae]|uniref:RNA polymerase subunit sigma-70 n=1 Tax=Jiangella rhizosphaerae TaxID=2293569 RepID=UPI0018F34619|nr:RNA polymerase subunit sigma-70 [Jiangella rhizosphaerae]